MKIWKPIVFIVGFALMIAFIAMWIGLIISFIVSIPFATFVFGSPAVAVLGAANIFFIVALPIIGFVQFAARYVFKKKTTSPRTRNGMTLFWVMNVISFFSVGSFVVRDFNQEDEITQVQELSISADTLRLSMAKEVGKNSIINLDGVKVLDDNLVIENIEIDFGKSEDDKFRLVQTIFSRGRNSQEIEKFIKAIEYQPIVKNGEIIFPSDFIIKKGSKWRAQKVRVRLDVPEGKTVKFGNKGERYRMHHYISDDARWERRIPSVNWLGEHIWTMQDKGWYSKADAIQEKKSESNLKDFKKVIVKGELKVNIEKGKDYDVKITGKERYLKSVTMEQVGEILEIKSSRERRGSPVRVNITAPDLERIDLEYTDDVHVKGFDGKKLDVFNEGRREVKVSVNVDSLYLNFKRNKSDIRGKGKFLKVKLGKGAGMDAEHYTAQNAFVTASVGRKIRLEVTDTLRTDLTNGSRMAYEDAPAVLIDERKERLKRTQERLKKANRQ